MDNITSNDVAAFTPLSNAIDAAVGKAGTARFHDILHEDVVGYALTLYHDRGRADVDECSEMLGSTIAMEVDFALDKGLTGPALRDAVVQAVVDAATLRTEGTESQ